MFDFTDKWPMGLSRRQMPVFVLASLIIIAALTFVDAPVTIWVAGLPDGIIAPFRVITRAGSSDWILIPALVGVILGLGAGALIRAPSQRAAARRIAATAGFIFAGVAVPGLITLVIKRLVGRSRPVNFDEYGIFHFQPNWGGDWTLQSFPSGDTTTIFALAAVIGFFFPRLFWWLLAGAALVGFSRIMVGMHYPSDVFGGILVGTFGAFAVRNFYASRGWIFMQDDHGAYLVKPGAVKSQEGAAG